MCNASVRVLSAGTVVILRARLNDQLRQRVGTVVRLSPQIIPRCRLAISKVIQHRTDDADDADARTEGTRAVVVRHRRVHAGAVVFAAARFAWDRARTTLKSAHARARRDDIIGLCLRYTNGDVRIRSRGRRNRAVCAATRSRTFAINASACGDRPHICMGKQYDVNKKRTPQE